MKKVSKNGQLFICSSCRKIHLEFGNIAMDFTTTERLQELQQYLHTVNSNHFENEVLSNNYRRQIFIPFANTTIKLLLSDKEINELMGLIQAFLEQSTDSNHPQPQFADLKMLSSLNSIVLN